MKIAPVGSRPGASGALVTDAPLERIVGELSRLDLPRVSGPTIETLLRAVPLTAADLAPFLFRVPQRYTRNVIHRETGFEVVAMCWPAGVRTPIHDHGGRRCFVSVVSGSLVSDEYVIVCGGRIAGPAEITHDRTQTLRSGDTDVRTPRVDIHRLSAPAGDAISLHIYAAPLDTYLVFDPQAGTCRDARSHDDGRPDPDGPPRR